MEQSPDTWSGTVGELKEQMFRGGIFAETAHLVLSVREAAELQRWERMPVALGLRSLFLAVECDPTGQRGWLTELMELGPFQTVELANRTEQNSWLAEALGDNAPTHCGKLQRLLFDGCALDPAAAERLARWPLLSLEVLRVLSSRVALDFLLDSAWSHTLRELCLVHCTLDDRTARCLASNTRLTQLEQLELEGTLLDPDFFAQFARTPFPRLRTLALRACGLGDREVKLLGQSALPSLVSLSLGGNELTDDGACSFAESPLFAQLEELFMAFDYGHELTLRGFHALKPATHEKILTLCAPGVDDETVQRLAVDPRLAEYEGLDFAFCAVGTPGVNALASSPFVSKLSFLNLSGARLGPGGMNAMGASPFLVSLRTLRLSFCPIAGGLAGFLQGRFVSLLSVLDLGGCGLVLEDCNALASAPLHELKELNLNDNALGDQGAHAIAAAVGLRALEDLYFGTTGLSDAGARALLQSSALRSVKRFYLHGNQFSEEFGNELRADARVASC